MLLTADACLISSAMIEAGAFGAAATGPRSFSRAHDTGLARLKVP